VGKRGRKQASKLLLLLHRRWLFSTLASPTNGRAPSFLGPTPTTPKQAAAKINREVAAGSLVVDYTGRVVRQLRGRLVTVEEVACSWGVARMHACVML